MMEPKESGKILKDLQKNLTCDVCREEYDDKNRKPGILPCYHTFCISCLHQLMENNRFLCPTCRHNFPPKYPIPVDSRIGKFVDLVKKHTQGSGSAAADMEEEEEKEQQLNQILKEIDEEDETWECNPSNIRLSPAFQGEPAGGRNEQLHQGRRFFWKGRLLFETKPRSSSKQRVSYSLKCFLTIDKGDPSINASHWPSSMKVDLVHWQLVLRLGVCDKSQRVAFHFSLPNLEPLRRLSQFLNSSGHVGCVLFPKMPQTTVRGLIVTFDVKTQAFIGYIPNNQEEFEQEVSRELLISKPQVGLRPHHLKQQPQPSTWGLHQSQLGSSPGPRPAALGESELHSAPLHSR